MNTAPQLPHRRPFHSKVESLVSRTIVLVRIQCLTQGSIVLRHGSFSAIISNSYRQAVEIWGLQRSMLSSRSWEERWGTAPITLFLQVGQSNDSTSDGPTPHSCSWIIVIIGVHVQNRSANATLFWIPPVAPTSSGLNRLLSRSGKITPLDKDRRPTVFSHAPEANLIIDRQHQLVDHFFFSLSISGLQQYLLLHVLVTWMQTILKAAKKFGEGKKEWRKEKEKHRSNH